MRYLALLLIVLLASCVSLPPKLVELRTDLVQLGACQAGDATMVATVTRVGSAYVTAKHFSDSEACSLGGLAVALRDPVDDLAVLQPGYPGICKDAEVGESVIYLGYPGTAKNGDTLTIGTVRMETDVGLVTHKNLTGRAGDIALPGIDLGSSRWVRPGYSGGAVVSARDGRIVGIINAITGEGQTLFTPITRVCRLIKEAANG